MRSEWLICSRYFGEGSLYRDKPYCVQPPLIYTLTYAASKALGFQHLHPFMVFLVGCSLLAVWLMMRYILRREGLAGHWMLFNLLFIFLIMANASDLLTLLPMVFFLGGFILYRCSSHSFRLILSGLFFSVSVLFKVVTIPLIAALIAYDLFFGGKFKWGKLVPPATLAAVLLAFCLFFPGMISHAVTAQAAYYFYGPAELLRVLSPLGGLIKQKLVFYVLSAYLIFLFANNRDLFSFVSLAFIPFFLTHIMRGGVSVIYTLYYYVPYSLLIIFALLYERAHMRKDKLRAGLNVAVAVVLLLYLSPLYRVWPLADHQIDPDLVQFQYGLEFMPQHGGRILTGYGNREYLATLFRELGLRESDYDFDYLQDVTSTYGIDTINGPMMLSAGIVKDISYAAEEKMTPEEFETLSDRSLANEAVLARLKRGEYSMVLLGPPDFVQLRKALNETNLSGYKCSVTVPNGYYLQMGGVHLSTVFFKDDALCAEMRDKVLEYYAKNYGAICSKSGYAAYVLNKYVFPLNGLAVKEAPNCNAGGEIFLGKSGTEGGDQFTYRELFKPYDLAVLAMTLAAALAITRPELLKGKAPKKRGRRGGY